MRKESLAFLEELVNTPSPTSYETRGQRVWLDYVSQFADETHHDEYGNCVATLNKGGGPRIMLAGMPMRSPFRSITSTTTALFM